MDAPESTDAPEIPQISPQDGTSRPRKIATEKLRTFHRNPRVGDVSLIMESLKANGQYRPLVVNVGTKTGRPNEVLAGNHLLAAAMKLHLPQVFVHWVDVDEAEANRIVLVDNRAADRGRYDEAELQSLLSDLDDFTGTGYDAEDLSALLDGPPEKQVTFAVKEKPIVVTVECHDEAEQGRTIKALEDLGYTVRAGR